MYPSTVHTNTVTFYTVNNPSLLFGEQIGANLISDIVCKWGYGISLHSGNSPLGPSEHIRPHSNVSWCNCCRRLCWVISSTRWWLDTPSGPAAFEQTTGPLSPSDRPSTAVNNRHSVRPRTTYKYGWHSNVHEQQMHLGQNFTSRSIFLCRNRVIALGKFILVNDNY